MGINSHGSAGNSYSHWESHFLCTALLCWWPCLFQQHALHNQRGVRTSWIWQHSTLPCDPYNAVTPRKHYANPLTVYTHLELLCAPRGKDMLVKISTSHSLLINIYRPILLLRRLASMHNAEDRQSNPHIVNTKKKPTNWLGQTKRRAAKIQPKAVEGRIFRRFFRTSINADRR